MKFPYYYKEEVSLPYGGYSGVIVFIDEKGYEHSQYTEDVSQMYSMETILDELGYQENVELNKFEKNIAPRSTTNEISINQRKK